MDADTIVNRKIKLLELTDNTWWLQPQTFDWYAQDIVYGGVQLIGAKCLPALRKHISMQLTAERPETAMSRLEEFYHPRRFVSADIVCGIHGYKNDVNRAKETKERRGQLANYDFELARRMNEL